MEQNLTNLRLAVLIDAENIPHSRIGGVMDEVAIYGTPTIKRIYGDLTSHFVSGWKRLILQHAITPVQHYSYTQGKNSSDSAMIIDAMDILYADKIDGFVIVSSDSDFTRLVMRLREAGKFVLGIGERKTPHPFVVACDKFTYIDVIRSNVEEDRRGDTQDTPAPGESSAAPPRPVAREYSEPSVIAPAPGRAKTPDDIVQLIADSVADLSNDGEGVFMGELGNLIRRKKPDFDCRNYGYNTLSALIKSIGRFSVDFRQTSDPYIKHPYVKDMGIES